jgi:hypothetical protein
VSPVKGEKGKESSFGLTVFIGSSYYNLELRGFYHGPHWVVIL